MKLSLQLSVMVATLGKNRLRALLALVAVGIGIASMMVMLALSTGAQQELQTIIDKVGKNLLTVKAGKLSRLPGRGEGWFSSTRLNLEDVETLQTQIGIINEIAPIMDGSLQVKHRRYDMLTTIVGTTPPYAQLRNFQISQGRFIDDLDNETRSRVAVVGSFVAKKLAGGDSLEGEDILIAGMPFKVIGVLKEKGISTDGANEDDQIIIPLSTALRRVFNVDYLTRMIVQVQDKSFMAQARNQIEILLRENHGIEFDGKNDFDIIDLLKADFIRKISNAMIGGLARFFAAITLIIGGIGVLSVMYLNVRERISEIGLRMAVGARRKDIAILFLMEACFLSICGGVIGLLLGYISVWLFRMLTDWAIAVDLGDVVVPFMISAFLGLLFGVLPAIKASRLKPVDALLTS